MKALFLIMTIALVTSSCSLLEKRKTHYSYAKQGVKIDDVKQLSGDPIHESFNGNETILVYNYCNASYLKEAVFGVLTFTTYNWACNKQMKNMSLYFKDGILYRKDEGIDATLVVR